MRTLQVLQVLVFASLAFDNCNAQGPQPVICITVPVDTSCQTKFGDDPGDTSCPDSVCFWNREINHYSCDSWPFPQDETRSLSNWNGTYKQSGYPDEEEQGVWGRLGLVQCVASRSCSCQWDSNTDEIRCMLDGPETQRALKYFLYASYVTSETCWGGSVQ